MTMGDCNQLQEPRWQRPQKNKKFAAYVLQRLLRYVEGFLPTPGHFYENRILIKIGFKPTFKPSKTVPDHVKLSFLSATLDPQEMARRYWSYEGFMPIFWFGLVVWMCKFLGF